MVISHLSHSLRHESNRRLGGGDKRALRHAAVAERVDGGLDLIFLKDLAVFAFDLLIGKDRGPFAVLVGCDDCPVERLRAIADSNGSAAARLRRMLLERVLFRFDSVQHYTESLSDVLAAIRPALLVRHNRHFDEEERVFAALLKEGKSDGEFVFKDIRGTARALLVATNALLPYSLSTRELGKRKDVEAQAAHIAELLIKGLKSPGS